MNLSISSIAVTCGNSTNFDSIIKLSVLMATKFNAKLHFLFFDMPEVDLSATLTGITFETEYRTNANTKDLSQRLNSIQPDLLILSNKTKDNNEGLFSFNDACKIIEHADKPVLTIPGNYNFEKFEKILIPIDTSFETRQKGPATVVMAQKFNSYVYILGVSTDKSKDSEVEVTNYSRQVSNKIAENGIDNEIEMRLGGNISEQTLAYANEIGADLVIIMTEQEINFKSFFTGKFSEQFIKNANLPVLSVNTKDLVVSEARL
ncbi:MAG: universal stress protein [Bacteroidia bacterium]|nr:universal stress protein [Bacteroidia bacterium]